MKVELIMQVQIVQSPTNFSKIGFFRSCVVGKGSFCVRCHGLSIKRKTR